jgi:hypothetical protein
MGGVRGGGREHRLPKGHAPIRKNRHTPGVKKSPATRPTKTPAKSTTSSRWYVWGRRLVSPGAAQSHLRTTCVALASCAPSTVCALGPLGPAERRTRRQRRRATRPVRETRNARGRVVPQPFVPVHPTHTARALAQPPPSPPPSHPFNLLCMWRLFRSITPMDLRARHKEAEARRAERVRLAFQDLATAMDVSAVMVVCPRSLPRPCNPPSTPIPPSALLTGNVVPVCACWGGPTCGGVARSAVGGTRGPRQTPNSTCC